MLSEPLELGAALGSIRSFVSGSGPTTAHLVESRESAIKLAENFGERNILALPTSGPAEGARLELN
jgi:4-diphosphocytidyl-2C-methyl-D-erythritol kinase